MTSLYKIWSSIFNLKEQAVGKWPDKSVAALKPLFIIEFLIIWFIAEITTFDILLGLFVFGINPN